MTQRFEVHPTHPQPRLLKQAAAVLKEGGLLALPTDACYVLACRLDDRAAVDRMRALRGLDEKHLLTLLCRDLKELATYAQVDNRQYRFLRDWTPGAYTFILPATKEVPRRLWHPSRKTVGLRVPDHPVILGLLAEHGEPVLGTSLILPGEDEPISDPDDAMAKLARRVDVVVDAGAQGFEPTTVIDMTGDAPQVTRVGRGPIDRMT
ncbi:MAG: L-threonylcarbamoyladenylate synthase [Burkholderiaceae bacterium]|nr:threonylcarbamoyl-AMP synthase [Burkholderiales bacterium]MCZ8106010.1 L-threonylcarbamoyladenylate synthase [Burkholderiales bacterium]MCZ8338637.1 L-threonylcarbamoyladenylate synthase [Burkholderiaceae bacterium]